jgi:hypothetical protein
MSISSVDSAPLQSAADSAKLPKFRTQQLLVLMAVVGVVLAISGPREIRGLDISPLAQMVFTVAGIIYTVVASIAITIVGYGVVWHRRGRWFFNEPGHWLLISVAADQLTILVEILLVSIVAAVQGTNTADVWLQVPYLFSRSLPGILLAILNVYIGRKKCSDVRWRRTFYAVATSQVLPVIGEMLVLIFLERAVRAERPRRKVTATWSRLRSVEPLTDGQIVTPARDLAHWCGVAIAFFMAGMTIAMVIFVIGFIIIPAILK